MDAAAQQTQHCAPMDHPSKKRRKKKGLSAHQAGLVQPVKKGPYGSDAVEEPPEPLTVMEEAVLTMVANKMTNREIEEETEMALGTIKKHLEHIYPKIKVRNRTEAAVWALERKLEARDKEIAILKELLAKLGGSSAASEPPPK